MDERNFQKEYYNRNREKFLEYFKQYKIDNKDKVIQYGKDYYQLHKEKYKTMVYCDACDRSYVYSNMPKHKKTLKHINNIN